MMTTRASEEHELSIYTRELSQLQCAWEAIAIPSQRILLDVSDIDNLEDQEKLSTHLRRAQYTAHMTAEIGLGIKPPNFVSKSHDLLLQSLSTCRETLGVLAIRADLDELNDDSASFGIQAIDLVRIAFNDIKYPSEIHRDSIFLSINNEPIEKDKISNKKYSLVASHLLASLCILLMLAISVEVLIKII